MRFRVLVLAFVAGIICWAAIAALVYVTTQLIAG